MLQILPINSMDRYYRELIIIQRIKQAQGKLIYLQETIISRFQQVMIVEAM